MWTYGHASDAINGSGNAQVKTWWSVQLLPWRLCETDKTYSARCWTKSAMRVQNQNFVDLFLDHIGTSAWQSLAPRRSVPESVDKFTDADADSFIANFWSALAAILRQRHWPQQPQGKSSCFLRIWWPNSSETCRQVKNRCSDLWLMKTRSFFDNYGIRSLAEILPSDILKTCCT